MEAGLEKAPAGGPGAGPLAPWGGHALREMSTWPQLLVYRQKVS
jgi:hypothetical protein